MELRILGPLALLVEEKQIPLGPRQRVLIIALLLARGHAITASHLAYLLWEGDPPQSWAATLRSHVHHVRQALARVTGPSQSHVALTTERLGGSFAYALRISDVTVDADHFERLLISGRQALGAGRYHQASALLRNALDLWRGQPLADVAGMPFAAGEIRRLQQLRRAAELARIESDAHRGLHHEIISDLAAMVTQWPDDEALRYLFIVCLYRCGRTALAAQACREGIEVLLDHGLDTSRLHGLQRLILGPPSRDPLPLAAWPQP